MEQSDENATQNQIQNTKVFLFQQALVIGQWVNKFTMANADEYLGEGLGDMLPPEVAAFSKYTDQQLREVEAMRLSPTNEYLN